MEKKNDICRNVEQNRKAFHKAEFTEEEIDEVEKKLTEALDVDDELTLFLLGQFYFEKANYSKALHYFEIMGNRGDWQSMFQLGVMYYDGLGTAPDMKRGFDFMYKVATSKEFKAKHLVFSACYNVGRAYYHGFGVRRSEELAEKYWLLAADQGNPIASIRAQSTLGLFYSLGDHLDLKRAFYFHSEACGNGSLESQGALGVMYLNGLGIKKDEKSAYTCLRDASRRGNVFAMGNLVEYYYKRKLFTKSVELAVTVSEIDNVEQISHDTDCLVEYIKNGISRACFYYARCLTLGHGVLKDENEAKIYYSLSFKFDKEVCASLQALTQHGLI